MIARSGPANAKPLDIAQVAATMQDAQDFDVIGFDAVKCQIGSDDELPQPRGNIIPVRAGVRI